jgi:hypothetical protein
LAFSSSFVGAFVYPRLFSYFAGGMTLAMTLAAKDFPSFQSENLPERSKSVDRIQEKGGALAQLKYPPGSRQCLKKRVFIHATQNPQRAGRFHASWSSPLSSRE